MTKQIISEEFKRMQKLAGIVTKSQLNENNTSAELKLQSKDFTYDTYNQWKDNLGDKDEIDFFKKLADKVQSGASTKEKFNETVARSFSTIEWKSKPEIKQSQPEKTSNELPKSNQKTLEEKIKDLTDKEIHTVTMNVGLKNKEALEAMLNLIKKVNPEVDIEKKKMSLERSWENETSEEIKQKAMLGISAASSIRNWFLDNLQIFK